MKHEDNVNNASLTLETLNLQVDVKLYRYSRETASRARKTTAPRPRVNMLH